MTPLPFVTSMPVHFLEALADKLVGAVPQPSVQDYHNAFDFAAGELQRPTLDVLIEMAHSDYVCFLLAIATLNNRPIAKPDRELVKFIDQVFGTELPDMFASGLYIAVSSVVDVIRICKDSITLRRGKSKGLYSSEPYWAEAASLDDSDAYTLAVAANIFGLSGTLAQVTQKISTLESKARLRLS